jgi:hypothetical protein
MNHVGGRHFSRLLVARMHLSPGCFSGKVALLTASNWSSCVWWFVHTLIPTAARGLNQA